MVDSFFGCAGVSWTRGTAKRCFARTFGAPILKCVSYEGPNAFFGLSGLFIRTSWVQAQSLQGPLGCGFHDTSQGRISRQLPHESEVGRALFS